MAAGMHQWMPSLRERQGTRMAGTQSTFGPLTILQEWLAVSSKQILSSLLGYVNKKLHIRTFVICYGNGRERDLPALAMA
ncbi:unnamed protein product [Citrullus colocynthis]|uniref:Uncharacterized protein n=1 Tax=Citrullus colocynthis TaxID=252529 RepID=A0ABP0XQV9_9ROSI